jgi:hypothetical protein
MHSPTWRRQRHLAVSDRFSDARPHFRAVGIVADKHLAMSSGSFKLSPIAVALYHEARGPVDIGIRDHYCLPLTPVWGNEARAAVKHTARPFQTKGPPRFQSDPLSEDALIYPAYLQGVGLGLH